jgi:hypothetical protein
MATEVKGTFDHEVIKAYLAADLDPSGHPKNAPEAQIYEADDVINKRPPKGKSTPSSSKCMGSCLYMDVGMWAGDGPAGSPEHYPRRRQFGIVAGNVAALCHYPEPKISPGETRWPKLSGRAPDQVFLRRIKLLLDALSQSDQLGAVEVTKLLPCWDFDRARVSLKKLNPLGDMNPKKHTTTYIFLGDMHLPVMTRLQRTYLLPDSEARRYIPRLSMPRLLVSRCGRLPAEDKEKELARQLSLILSKKAVSLFMADKSLVLYFLALLGAFYLPARL